MGVAKVTTIMALAEITIILSTSTEREDFVPAIPVMPLEQVQCQKW